MESYVELIRQDVIRHESRDASLWPSYVSDFARSLQNQLKIPDWFKADLAKLTNDGVTDLPGQPSMYESENAKIDLCDGLDEILHEEMDQRLRTVFNTALADCARIRTVMEAESLTDTLYPKQSFLVILVRNAILEAHERLSSLEDASVVLPRHFSRQEIPLLSYVKKCFYAPLVISINQEMGVEENGSDLGRQPSDEENSSDELGLSRYSPLSMSEWLDICERPRTPEEEEEEEEEGLLSPDFEAHFLSYPPSATPPSVCHIPVLCMADEEQLPVLLSSLLYQRRVWRISDPIVGLEFSKYSTTVRLIVGWLDEEELSSRHALPRVHLGEIRTALVLDLSSPSVALVISRLLCSLESYIYGVRDTARHSVGAVISDTQSDPSISWRIDTDDIQEGGSGPIPANNKTRDMIIQWLKSQRCSVGEDNIMHASKRGGKKGLSSSATSSSTSQSSTFAQRPYRPPPSSYTSGGESSSILKSRDSSAKTRSQQSCSKFAATGEKNDYQVFRWMFDRGVVPQPITNDLEFREEYSTMTSFIWPETWNCSGDLPSVDPALKPWIEELLAGVDALKRRPGAVKCVPVEEFPVDLRILEHSFSAIFQASRRSREKAELLEDVYEAAWRHDHDRLLFDFFIRLVQSKKSDAIHSLVDRYSVANLEDPLSRPTLETTLRLPRSEDMQIADQNESIRNILRREAADLADWLQRRGGPTKVVERGHALHADVHCNSWMAQTLAETKAQRLATLRQAPSTGQCDAMGRLLVELPNVSSDAVGHFQLVVRKSQRGKGAQKVKTQSAHTFLGKGVSSSPLAGATGSSVMKNEMKITATPYTIPSSSAPTSMHSVDGGQMGPSENVDGLAEKVEQLQLDGDATYLELPIFTAEYKKAGENLMQGTNQLRMYLTASVKFLQAIGITNFPVYGVQTDGPIVVLPAAVVRDDNFVYLFERLTEKLDISTPVGAWHYATILCRLAQRHAKLLEEKFERVRDGLVASLKNGDQMESWTMEQQLAQWKAAGELKPVSEVKQADESG